MLNQIKRLEAAHLPTPLERADRLADALAGPRIYVKRDDVTGLAGGGNKARKLEYLAAQAQELGAHCLATVGGPQSNHARMTAALAARMGLKCRLYLKGKKPKELRGNLLLDRLLGAEIIFCGDEDYPEIYQRIAQDRLVLSEQGIEVYMIPIGGSAPVGALGYARAIVHELKPQCLEAGFKPGAIAVAAGSGGTMAGILLGLALAGWQDVPVYGYSVSYDVEYLQTKVAEIFNDAALLIQTDHKLKPNQVIIDADHIGEGYGIATPGALEALTLFARNEGLLLDSVYTAKAAAGMIADIRAGKFSDNVVYIHTGGWPALFAKDDVESWLQEEQR